MATIKLSPSGQAENRFPLKVFPNFRLCPARGRSGQKSFLSGAIKAAWRGLANQERRLSMTKNFTEKPETGSNAPGYIAFNLRPREGSEPYWMRIGAMWPHLDGNGFNLLLDTLPLDGRVVLRLAAEKDAGPEAE
jgi:hypothetical protein